MEALREYVLSVVAAAILCAVLNTVGGKSKSGETVFKLVTSLFLTFVIIRPIAKIELRELDGLISDWKLEAAAASAIGEGYYEEALAEVIQQECEAYILDKARALDVELEITVTLDGDRLPEEAVVQGRLSPFAKAQLQKVLTEDLGIAKERQIWIG